MENQRPTLRGEIDLIAEVESINRLASGQGLVIRLIGALAFWKQCPKYRYLHGSLNRVYTDIDLAAYYSQKQKIEHFFSELGFIADRSVASIPGLKRSIFHNRKLKYHIDVFYDELDMCHLVDLRNRLEIDPLTISITDLFLEKVQIVKINKKDLIDLIMLLLEYSLVEKGESGINLERISRICQRDWGWTHTLLMNLEKVVLLVKSESGFSSGEIGIIEKQTSAIRSAVELVPKSLAWKLRAKVGERRKWYKDVEEVY